ncbi:hypothetical protein [Prauserella muralis]|uniref:Uncharacterized protein n=1 Tax=Prauserella muralis TaxID=588067 RepID=A0A2V4BBF6_9PSEU|nr:hypothetical protein [Prauserella muralis]PXY31379.1 hypothetical protein BAY60_03035 [Prauserella muralis]TWE14295.1 hypothetical protein FHX69_6435 [Prauserella muralis]
MLASSRARSRFVAVVRQLATDVAFGIDAASAIRHGGPPRPYPPRRTRRRQVCLPRHAETVRLGEYPPAG